MSWLREEITAFNNQTEMNSFGSLVNQVVFAFVVVALTIQACRLMASLNPNHQRIGEGLATLIVIQVIAKLVTNTVGHATTRLTAKQRYEGLAAWEEKKTEKQNGWTTKERPAMSIEAKDRSTINVDAEGVTDGVVRRGE